jgi:hypothetical protein
MILKLICYVKALIFDRLDHIGDVFGIIGQKSVVIYMTIVCGLTTKLSDFRNTNYASALICDSLVTIVCRLTIKLSGFRNTNYASALICDSLVTIVCGLTIKLSNFRNTNYVSALFCDSLIWLIFELGAALLH